MRARVSAILAVTAALAAGCGDDVTSTSSTDAGGPLVTYVRAGGIAFTAQHLVVEADGSATVRVEGPGDVGADFQLPDAELDELRAALADATLEGDSAPTGCADCYSYEITSGRRTASFDQTQIPPGTEPLVSLLEEIVAREAPSGPARGA